MPVTNTLVATWVDYAGNSHTLDGTSNVLAVLGAQGLWMPPMLPIEQKVPLAAGARLRYVQTDVRPFLLPLLITGSTYSNRWINQRAAITWFDPTQPRGSTTAVLYTGNGVLKLAAPDGSTRQLACYCADGLEMVQDDQNEGALWQYAVAALRATDPYWYDTAATVRGAVASALNTLVADTVTTSGDVEAWPIWTITFTVAASQSASTLNITITDTSTGYSLLLTGLAIGSTGGSPVAHTVVVDTRPTVKTITLDGVNAFYSLAISGGAALFPLRAGANVMNYTVALAPAPTLSVAPAVQVTYTNRYNTP